MCILRELGIYDAFEDLGSQALHVERTGQTFQQTQSKNTAERASKARFGGTTLEAAHNGRFHMQEKGARTSGR